MVEINEEIYETSENFVEVWKVNEKKWKGD